MSNLKLVGTSKPHRVTHTTVDTIVVTPDLVKSWKSPPFQRPLRVNAKVLEVAEQIKADGGVIPGVITIGVLNKEKYLLDGQHRREAYLIAELPEGFCDIRYQHFEEMADMGEEFIKINGRLVVLRPDDVLRGLEGSSPGLSHLRKECPFVGYDMIRRGDRSPIVSMSATLRCWFASAADAPSSRGTTALHVARSLTKDDSETVACFLKVVERAWGRDVVYQRLWGNLNLALCMWIYRRMVLAVYSGKIQRLSKDLFYKSMTTLSADSDYLDWLVGRQLGDRDRSPAYNKIKTMMAKRIGMETGKKQMMPSPSWASH